MIKPKVYTTVTCLGFTDSRILFYHEHGEGLFSTKSRVNRSSAAEMPALPSAVAGPSADAAAIKGQLLDPPTEPAYFKTLEQLKDLDEMYAVGMARKKDKVAPELAIEPMAKCRCITTHSLFCSFRVEFCAGCVAVDWSDPPANAYAGDNPDKHCALLADTPCTKHQSGVAQSCRQCNCENGIVLRVGQVRAYFAKSDPKFSQEVSSSSAI